MFYTKEGSFAQEYVVAVDSSATDVGDSMCACVVKRIREQSVLQ
jgi:phage terminase large subunit-like protein